MERVSDRRASVRSSDPPRAVQRFGFHTGARLLSSLFTQLTPTDPVNQEAYSRQSRLVALLLCWFLGVFGAHRFYVGKTGTAVLQILTFGGLGIWVLIDLVIITVGAFRDVDGRLVYVWMEEGSI